jgi:hypothetical protein
MRTRRELIFTSLLAVCLLMYFGAFLTIDTRLLKQNVLFFDQARAQLGNFTLNDRVTPMYHPLFSLFVAIMSIFPGMSSIEVTARLLSMFSAAGVVILLWRWMRDTEDVGSSWAVIVISCTNVMLIYFATAAMGETLGLFFFVLNMTAVWYASTRISWRWLITAGISAGLFALTRTEGYGYLWYVLLPLATFTWYTTRNWRTSAVRTLIHLAISTVVILPNILLVQDFTGDSVRAPDKRFIVAASVLRRIPEPMWQELQASPVGTVTTGERMRGIDAIHTVLGKVTYVIRESAEMMFHVNQHSLSQVLGAAMLLLIMMGIAPGLKHKSIDTLRLGYIVYICMFTACVLVTVVAYDFDKYETRKLIYLVPPCSILAAIGASRVADLIGEHLGKVSGINRSNSNRILLAVILTLYVGAVFPAIYTHVRDVRDLNVLRSLQIEASEFLRAELDGATPIVGADDVFVSYEADGWYVPVHPYRGSEIVQVAERYGAHFVVVQGMGLTPWRNGMESLLARSEVPPGLEFLREFGDPTDFHVVVYRVLSLH